MESTANAINQCRATSEWLCTHTGITRIQYTHCAIDQLISSIVSILTSSDLTAKTTAEHSSLLRDLSQLCVPIVHLPKTIPVVEALLLRVKNGSDLSGEFWEKITELQRGYTNTTQLALSYDARVVLWTTHLPSFEQELLDLLEAVRSMHQTSKIDETVKHDCEMLLTSRQLPKACVECSQLFLYAEEFFKVLFVCISSEPATTVVTIVRELNKLLAEEHSKQVLRKTTCPQLRIEVDLLP